MLQKKPGMGKTAVMKIIFMLQQVKGIDLGYEFSIYTYGPYTSEVLEDIDELISRGLLTSTVYHYKDYIGYQLNITSEGVKGIDHSSENLNGLEDVLQFTNNKSAKELELYSTIIYISDLFVKNSWEGGKPSIVDKVHEIKPHFSKEDILKAYECLQEKKYISTISTMT